MKIKYLGTAAAEGIPAIFCECETCKKARELGGKDIRTRSQALINDDLLVDFPADTYMHYLQHKFPMNKIKNCIITHSHSDHLYPKDIIMRAKGYCVSQEEFETLHFYSDKSGYDIIKNTIETYNIRPEEVRVHHITVNKSFTAGGYKITPIRAEHDVNSSPVIYAIEKDGKNIFYCNDTSDFSQEGWECLKELGVKFNLVSLDCTAAWEHIEYVGHMNVQRCNEVRRKLFEYGLADENTIFVLNHFSHNGKGVLYDEFLESAGKEGYRISYDGMVIEI